MNNHDFIDAQNLYLGIKEQGWKLDYRRFRNYLRDKFEIERAFIFIGYIEQNQGLYKMLERARFDVIFKEIIHQDGVPKGNIDADLIVHAMSTINDYGEAVLVTSDGDFRPLVEHWKSLEKLRVVLSPLEVKCSSHLKRSAGSRIRYLSEIQHKLELKQK